MAPFVDRLKVGFQTHPLADRYFGGHYSGLDTGSFKTMVDRGRIVHINSGLYEGGVLSAEQFSGVPDV